MISYQLVIRSAKRGEFWRSSLNEKTSVGLKIDKGYTVVFVDGVPQYYSNDDGVTISFDLQQDSVSAPSVWGRLMGKIFNEKRATLILLALLLLSGCAKKGGAGLFLGVTPKDGEVTCVKCSEDGSVCYRWQFDCPEYYQEKGDAP